ncbi:DUF3575 domain-containing protein [Zobellia galactanivorans]|uniref:Conserved hypothetical periplasmic protein n=1 Tax=Zobellia galactanivorans (strain DSM 12802 / CCUG 47099 / CIP 106680 / NCIMB 13871 / Dsij) TaxID=63186 RepID=G0L7E8_ZOBGA|nr:DUF3575 domain-containing protein [Zobellia galactanivorans]CAZ97366.1 Conserved hypothetical periplasmic protein [Zobellia galactanivorans]
MKKYFLITTMLFSFLAVNGQNQKETIPYSFERKNELKINVYFTALGLLESTYERNLNRKSSLGITGLYAFSQKYDEDVNFQISPFYRRYFGKKYASGFFTEGFATIGSTDGKQLTDINGNLTPNEGPDVIDLSLGLSIGYKWVTKSGISIEALFGMGGNLFNADKTDHNIINRRAISIGYRF